MVKAFEDDFHLRGELSCHGSLRVLQGLQSHNALSMLKLMLLSSVSNLPGECIPKPMLHAERSFETYYFLPLSVCRSVGRSIGRSVDQPSGRPGGRSVGRACRVSAWQPLPEIELQRHVSNDSISDIVSRDPASCACNLCWHRAGMFHHYWVVHHSPDNNDCTSGYH